MKAKKDCDRRRKVTISGLGKTSTSKDGQFSFTFPGNSAAPGNYKVRVKGKRYSRGGGENKKKFKCKPTEKTHHDRGGPGGLSDLPSRGGGFRPAASGYGVPFMKIRSKSTKLVLVTFATAAAPSQSLAQRTRPPTSTPR